MPRDELEPISDLRARLLTESALVDRHVRTRDGHAVHAIETGEGKPLVVLHGTGDESLFLLPLIERLHGRRVVAIDRPGHGRSDPVPLPRDRYREACTTWLGEALDALDIDRAALLGYSMGGLYATWFALAHPDRVERLVLMGAAPGLPGTTVPTPFAVLATPLLGAALNRRPATRESMLGFAAMIGEEEALRAQPDMLDLLVAGDADSSEAARAETMAIISPLSLLPGIGFRPGAAIEPDELRALDVPALLVWGEDDPVGGPDAARRVADLLPNAEVGILDTGHSPWLGRPDRCADLVNGFLVPA
ncbi:MAG: alpha/beta hydrolase [Acidimicrobiia bacterium]